MKLAGRAENSEIEELLSQAEREMERVGVEKEDRLRFRLSAEELLLESQRTAGEPAAFTLDLKRRNGREQIELAVFGRENDLLSKARHSARDAYEEPSAILHRTLEGWEHAPDWRYESGQNIYHYALPLPKSPLENLSFTWRFTRGQRGYLFLAIAAQLIAVVMMVIAPIASARVIKAYATGSVPQIILSALALMIVGMITDLFNALCNYLYNLVYNKTLTALESRLVGAVLRLSNACLDEKGTGLFIQRLTVDTSTLATGFNTMADLTAQMFTYIGILGAILITSPPVFAAVSALLALQILIERQRSRRLTADDRIFRNANERYTGFVSEMVRGSRDVKLMHQERVFEQELNSRIREANHTRMTRDGHSWRFKLFRGGASRAGSFGIAALLALLFSQKQIASADALVLYSYYTSFDVSAVLILGQFLEFMKGFHLSNERVRAIVESHEFPKEPFGGVHLSEFRGGLSFEHVFFAYDRGPQHAKRWIIRDMSFQIHPGQTVALVGRSGCGKTTAFHLISKLYTASRGAIALDGTDIRELDADSIRDNIAVVSQNPYLFHMSIRDNLRMAKPDMTPEEMRHACALACIDGDIEAMPDGYDSMLSEGGANLSGGQRQRLAIARALLKDFRILLLDEATSALDSVTQAKIQKAIKNMKGSRTVFVIAHRLSTVEGADKILFMENGRIAEEGTHQELMQRCASYRELHEAEMGTGTV